MASRQPVTFAPRRVELPAVAAAPPPSPSPAAVQLPMLYPPPPSARPLCLVDRAAGPTPPPMDRIRDRPDGSTVVCRIGMAPPGAPAAWAVRIVATTRQHGAPAKAHARMLYVPTRAAAIAAQAAAMLAMDAAYDAAAERLPAPVLSIVGPGDVEPRPAPTRRGPSGSTPTRAAG